MILCLGDSITAGSWLEPGEDWPSLVASQVEDEIVNRAIGGTCIAFPLGEHRRSWEDMAPLVTARLHPETLIMAAGMNDLIRTETMSVVTDAIYRLTEKILNQGVIVLWATITPLAEHSQWAEILNGRRLVILDWLRANFPDDLIDWEGELRDGTPWIDAAWDIGGDAPSHPNAIGQQRLADFLLDEW